MLRDTVSTFATWVKIIFIIQSGLHVLAPSPEKDLSNNEDVMAAIDQFVKNFETKNGVKIGKHDLVNDVVKAGDNMLSGIFRLNFEYMKCFRTRKGSVVLKIPSLAPMPYSMLKNTNMFDREIHFYTTLLPKLYQLGKCKPFAPQLYASTTAAALVMEDLSLEGFKPGDRVKQLDMDHTRISLSVLAKYHALGNKYLQSLNKNDPSWSLIGSNQPTLASPPRKDAFDNFCKMVEPFLSKPLYQKIVKLENEIQADPFSKNKPSGQSITVILHADYRTNNILFKYNAVGKVTDVKLIDWQLSREGNPALDLIYFFVTSVPTDMFSANDDTLMNFYLSQLNQFSAASQSSRSYNRSQLDKDIKYYSSYYLKVICIIWQTIMRAGQPGPDRDAYILNSVKWLNYLEKKGLI